MASTELTTTVPPSATMEPLVPFTKIRESGAWNSAEPAAKREIVDGYFKYLEAKVPDDEQTLEKLAKHRDDLDLELGREKLRGDLFATQEKQLGRKPTAPEFNALLGRLPDYNPDIDIPEFRPYKDVLDTNIKEMGGLGGRIRDYEEQQAGSAKWGIRPLPGPRDTGRMQVRFPDGTTGTFPRGEDEVDVANNLTAFLKANEDRFPEGVSGLGDLASQGGKGLLGGLATMVRGAARIYGPPALPAESQAANDAAKARLLESGELGTSSPSAGSANALLDLMAGSLPESPQQDIQKFTGDVNPMRSTAAAIGQTIPSLAAAAAGSPVAALGLNALQIGQGSYEEAVAGGATDEEAGKAGFVTALLTAPIDTFSDVFTAGVASKALKPLIDAGGKSLTRSILGAGGRVLKEATEKGIAEGLTEGTQETIANAIAKQVWDENRDLLQGVPESVGIGFLTGGLLAGSFQGTGEVTNGIRKFRAGEKAEKINREVAALEEVAPQEEESLPVPPPVANAAAKAPPDSPQPVSAPGSVEAPVVAQPSHEASVGDQAAEEGRQVIPPSYEVPEGLKQGAGWKLHLGTKNKDEVSKALESMGLAHKVGRSSGQTGKDITVYVGARDDAEAMAVAINSRIGELLDAPSGDALETNEVFNEKVSGRFDASGDQEFNQYGKGGVPDTNDAVSNRIWGGSAPFGNASQRLAAKYGSFFSGTKTNQPTATTPTNEDETQDKGQGQEGLQVASTVEPTPPQLATDGGQPAQTGDNSPSVADSAGQFDLSQPTGGRSMSEIRTTKVGNSTLVYQVSDEGLSLSSVRTPLKSRGIGSARKALELLTEESDAADIPISLLASPLDKKTSSKKLVAFYESLGFVKTGRSNAVGDPYMVRVPVSKKSESPATPTPLPPLTEGLQRRVDNLAQKPPRTASLREGAIGRLAEQIESQTGVEAAVARVAIEERIEAASAQPPSGVDKESGTGQNRGINNESSASGENIASRSQADSSTGDAEYLKAVASGDMEAVQHMVDDAASKSGLIEAWHGFRKGGMQGDSLDPGRILTGEGTAWFGDDSFSFGSTVGTARSYAGKNGEVKRFFIPKPDRVGFSSTHNNILEVQPGLGVVAGYHHDMDANGPVSKDDKTIINSGGLTRELAEKYGTIEEYSVSDKNTIKSADPVIYDKDGKVIPLSRRFTPSPEEEVVEPVGQGGPGAASIGEKFPEYYKRKFQDRLTQDPTLDQAVKDQIMEDYGTVIPNEESFRTGHSLLEALGYNNDRVMAWFVNPTKFPEVPFATLTERVAAGSLMIRNMRQRGDGFRGAAEKAVDPDKKAQYLAGAAKADADLARWIDTVGVEASDIGRALQLLGEIGPEGFIKWATGRVAKRFEAVRDHDTPVIENVVGQVTGAVNQAGDAAGGVAQEIVDKIRAELTTALAGQNNQKLLDKINQLKAELAELNRRLGAQERGTDGLGTGSPRQDTEAQRARRDALNSLVEELEGRAQTPAEQVAEQVRAPSRPQEPPVDEEGNEIVEPYDPITDMVRVLVSIAKERIPRTEKPPGVKDSAVDQMNFLQLNATRYRRVWEEAQEIVRERYADDPNALRELDDYFGHVLVVPFTNKLAGEAVIEQAQQMGVRLRAIREKLRGNPETGQQARNLGELDATEQELLRTSVIASLVNRMDGTDQNREATMVAISQATNGMLAGNRRAELEKIIGKPGSGTPPVDPSPNATAPQHRYERMIRALNLGALDTADGVARFTRTFGLRAFSSDAIGAIGAAVMDMRSTDPVTQERGAQRLEGLMALSENRLDGSISQALVANGDRIHDLVKQGVAKGDAARERLIESLTQEAGLTEEQATEVVGKARDEFEKRMATEKARLLKQKGTKASGHNKRKGTTLVDKFIEAASIGAFDPRDKAAVDVVLDDYYGELGLRRNPTEDEKKHLKALAQKMDEAPDGRPKAILLKEIHDYMEGMLPTSYSAIFSASWHASLLSSTATGAVTLLDNAVSLLTTGLNILLGETIKGRPGNGIEIINQMRKSKPAGMAAFFAAMRGEPVLDSSGKFGIRSGVLERAGKKARPTFWSNDRLLDDGMGELEKLVARSIGSGKTVILNQKYATRVISAGDGLSSTMRREAEAYRRELNNQYAGGTRGEQARLGALKALRLDQESLARNVHQATEELAGLPEGRRKRNEIMLRTLELSELARDSETREYSNLRADQTSLMHEMEGVLGVFLEPTMKAIDKMARRAEAMTPLENGYALAYSAKAAAFAMTSLTAFTRMAVNVWNSGINYAGVGAARGLYGGVLKSHGNFGAEVRKYSPEEKQDRILESIQGVVLLYALSVLNAAFADDDDPPFAILGQMGDYNESTQRQAGGNLKPHSIKIGPLNVIYKDTRLAPFLAIVGAMGDRQRWGDKEGNKEPDLDNTVEAASAMFRVVTEMSFMKTANAIAGEHQFKGAGARLTETAQNIMSGMVPWSAMAREVEGVALGTMQRQSATTLGDFGRRVPIIGRLATEPAIDRLGQPVPQGRQWKPVSRFFGVARGDAEGMAEETWEFLNRHEIVLPPFEQKPQMTKPQMAYLAKESESIADLDRQEEMVARIADGRYTKEEGRKILVESGTALMNYIHQNMGEWEQAMDLPEGDPMRVTVEDMDKAIRRANTDFLGQAKARAAERLVAE